jgi:hypothetical protein
VNDKLNIVEKIKSFRSIGNDEKNDFVSLISIALEIQIKVIKESFKTPLPGMVQNLIYAFIPIIYQYLRDEDEWCVERKRIYWITFMGVFMTRTINWILVMA